MHPQNMLQPTQRSQAPSSPHCPPCWGPLLKHSEKFWGASAAASPGAAGEEADVGNYRQLGRSFLPAAPRRDSPVWTGRAAETPPWRRPAGPPRPAAPRRTAPHRTAPRSAPALSPRCPLRSAAPPPAPPRPPRAVTSDRAARAGAEGRGGARQRREARSGHTPPAQGGRGSPWSAPPVRPWQALICGVSIACGRNKGHPKTRLGVSKQQVRASGCCWSLAGNFAVSHFTDGKTQQRRARGHRGQRRWPFRGPLTAQA